MEFTSLTIITALVVGLTEVAKRIGLPKRFVPGVALLVGVGLSFFFLQGATVTVVIGTGLVAGLTASGLWSGTKTSVRK